MMSFTVRIAALAAGFVAVTVPGADAAYALPTCRVDAIGGPLVQRTNYVVGELGASDFAAGTAACAGTDPNARYTATLKVQVEVPASGTWIVIPGCVAIVGTASVEGSLGTETHVVCDYGGTTFLNTDHRAHAILTLSLPGAPVQHAYSTRRGS
jgi:hypothetical protein